MSIKDTVKKFQHGCLEDLSGEELNSLIDLYTYYIKLSDTLVLQGDEYDTACNELGALVAHSKHINAEDLEKINNI